MGIFDAFALVTDTLEDLKALPSFTFGRKSGGKEKVASVGEPTRDAEGDRDEDTKALERSGDFSDFIKRMLEIRAILRTANLSDSFQLPSIVVLGSQSSGKSSVLETIVGHDFLPKGPNMVTRRPLELTLVHTPTATRDYAVFEGVGGSSKGEIYDFTRVRKTLEELNLAVPEGEWISDKPICLTIHSRNIPDLSLVDLPGYIQLSSRTQPPALREAIRSICERYIRAPNIILAVCPADVDLANSEALQASRRVDPRGERTIGVITKMDLVDPGILEDTLSQDHYPLAMGYIGMVCGPSAREASHRPRSFPFGVGALRERLTDALEERLGGSVEGLLMKAHEDLSEVRYQLKVHYNDRVISPEGYMAFLLTNLQSGFEDVARSFGRAQVRQMLKGMMQERVLHLAMEFFATSNGPSEEAISKNEQQLERSLAQLTRSGIGRLASQAMVEAIMEAIQKTIMEGPLKHHPAARERLLRHVESTLRRRSRLSTEQVENALKPFKHAIDYEQADWTRSRSETLAMLRNEETRLTGILGDLQEKIGSRKLRRAVEYLLEQTEKGSEDLAANFSPITLELAKEAVQLQHRLAIVRKRLGAISQTSCQLPEAVREASAASSSYFPLWIWKGTEHPASIRISNDRCHAACPEIYLNLVADKLVEASALFVHYELVHEFLHPLPDELVHTIRGTPLASQSETASTTASASTDNPGTLLGGLGLGREEMVAFVRENTSVSRHLDLQERRRALERVCEKLEYLIQRKREQEQKQRDEQRTKNRH